MDINHRDCRRRWLLRRIIRCRFLALVACGTAFLLLIILLPLDAARSENHLIGPTNDLPAYVSKVEIAENIVVRHLAKQEAGITGHYEGYLLLKLCLLHGEAVLSRPYCGRSRSWIGGTLGSSAFLVSFKVPRTGPT